MVDIHVLSPMSLISRLLSLFIVHLHGHSFQVLYRSEDNAGTFQLDNIPEFPVNPMRRDVLLIPPAGYAILAFRADNPGAWFLYDLISPLPSLSPKLCTDIGVPAIVILIGTLSRAWLLNSLKPRM